MTTNRRRNRRRRARAGADGEDVRNLEEAYYARPSHSGRLLLGRPASSLLPVRSALRRTSRIEPRKSRMLTDRLPPHDIEAEEAVIASILVDSEAIYNVAPILNAEDFFREKNAWAYEACLSPLRSQRSDKPGHHRPRAGPPRPPGGDGRPGLPQPARYGASDARRRRALRPHRQARRRLPAAHRSGEPDRADGLQRRRPTWKRRCPAPRACCFRFARASA